MSTKIEWTDETWNPTTGCTKVSPGCDNCYAKTMHERFKGPGSFDTVSLHPDRLDKPFHWRKPRKVFVNSMSDLFHQDIPDEFIAEVWAVMAMTPDHTFQVLTKRHGRMRSLLGQAVFRQQIGLEIDRLEQAGHCVPDSVERGGWWPLRNVWLGVSVEDQKWADIRIPALLATPAAVRFLSCEPLLGRVDLTRIAWRQGGGTHLDVVKDFHGEPHIWRAPAKRVDWVIVGGESGPGARPMHPDWARTIRDRCQAARVPFLFKQWGEWGDLAPLNDQGQFDFRGGHALANDGTLYKPGDLAYPDGPRYGEAVRADHGHAHLTAMYKLGKKRAGRDLDDRTWDEYPAVSA